jgi:hypothetical protein
MAAISTNEQNPDTPDVWGTPVFSLRLADSISGEETLPGFVLDMQTIWMDC